MARGALFLVLPFSRTEGRQEFICIGLTQVPTDSFCKPQRRLRSASCQVFEVGDRLAYCNTTSVSFRQRNTRRPSTPNTKSDSQDAVNLRLLRPSLSSQPRVCPYSHHLSRLERRQSTLQRHRGGHPRLGDIRRQRPISFPVWNAVDVSL